MSSCAPPIDTGAFTIGEVIRRFGQQYIDEYHPSYRVVKILRNIANCKTAALGGHLVSCTACGYQKRVYNSCGNSNCPQCQNIKKQLWIDKMVQQLLPTKHYHIVFTIPHELNDLVFYNQKLFYGLLFKSAWQSIEKIVGAGKTGMVATLHTWGSNLSFHPHIHCIVPEGKLIGDQWVRVAGSNQRCYCNARELRETFKDIFIQHLVRVLEDEDLYIGPSDKGFASLAYLQGVLGSIRRKKWCVRIESPVLGVKQIVEYLGRYIKRVAITNSRIESITQTHVQFKYKVYAKQQKGKAAPTAVLPIAGPAFIQRFVQHLLPAYFQRVRYFGLYGAAAKKSKAKAYQLLTGLNQQVYTRPLKRQLLEKMLGLDPDVCPACACYCTLQTMPLVADSKGYFSFTTYWRPISVVVQRGPPTAAQTTG